MYTTTPIIKIDFNKFFKLLNGKIIVSKMILIRAIRNLKINFTR